MKAKCWFCGKADESLLCIILPSEALDSGMQAESLWRNGRGGLRGSFGVLLSTALVGVGLCELNRVTVTVPHLRPLLFILRYDERKSLTVHNSLLKLELVCGHSDFSPTYDHSCAYWSFLTLSYVSAVLIANFKSFLNCFFSKLYCRVGFPSIFEQN